MDNKIDLFPLFKTKLSNSFPIASFLIQGFISTFRCDRNEKGVGPLLYICKDIQSRLPLSKSECNIVTLLVEVKSRKREWFLNCSCNRHQICFQTILNTKVVWSTKIVRVWDFDLWFLTIVNWWKNFVIWKIFFFFQLVTNILTAQQALILFWQIAQVTFNTLLYLKLVSHTSLYKL